MSKRTPVTTREWLDHYEKLRYKAFYNYQVTGESRYDNQEFKYAVIVEALRAKLERTAEQDRTINKRMNNCNHVVDSLLKPEYTRDEVIDLLKKAVWW